MATYSFLTCFALAYLFFLSIDDSDVHLFCSCDPTVGFSNLPLTEWNFEKIEYPRNAALSNRYIYRHGVRTFMLYSSDDSPRQNIQGRPRTEIRVRFHGPDYSSGVWQFQGDLLVARGTDAAVMQIKRDGDATPMMLHTDSHRGQLRFFGYNLREQNIYNRWMRINVIHDVDADMVTVFVDGVQKLQVAGSGHGTFYFKFGVYAKYPPSRYMESRWSDVHILKRDG